jgi:hypothetical protein
MCYKDEAMTCQQVAARFKAAGATVRKWAADNGVAYIGEGKRKTYQWTEEDCQRFAERKRPGWKKGRSRKPDNYADNETTTTTGEIK